MYYISVFDDLNQIRYLLRTQQVIYNHFFYSIITRAQGMFLIFLALLLLVMSEFRVMLIAPSGHSHRGE